MIIEVQCACWRLVPQRLRKFVVERHEWRRNDGLLAPSAIASAIAAEMFAVGRRGEVTEIEMRIAAVRAIDAIHIFAQLKRCNEVIGRWRGCSRD